MSRRRMMQPTLKRAIIAFVLASIIIVSFAALMHQQKSFTFSATAEKIHDSRRRKSVKRQVP